MTLFGLLPVRRKAVEFIETGRAVDMRLPLADQGCKGRQRYNEFVRLQTMRSPTSTLKAASIGEVYAGQKAAGELSYVLMLLVSRILPVSGTLQSHIRR